MRAKRRSLGLPLIVTGVLLALAGCGPSAQVLTTPVPQEQPSVPFGPDRPTPIPLDSSAASQAPAGPPGATVPFQVVDFPIEGAYEVTGVTWTGATFVAVGFGGLDGAEYYGRRQGLVWTSTDGISWQQIVDPAFRDVTPYRVVALGSDVYAMGELSACDQLGVGDCTESPEAGTALLRSSNGGPWQLLPEPQEVRNAVFDDLVVAQNVLVAFGSADDYNETATLWLSDDGSSWVPTNDLAGLEPVSALAGTETRFAAMGTRYLRDVEDVSLGGATSTDGIHFDPSTVPGLTAVSVDSMAAGPAGLVAVGYTFGNDALSEGLALQSPDGLSWSQGSASDGSFDGGLLIEVHPTADGYVATGYVPDPEDYGIQTGWLWASADGQAWRGLGQIGDPFSQYGATAVGPPGLIFFSAAQEDTGDDLGVDSKINSWFVPLDQLAP